MAILFTQTSISKITRLVGLLCFFCFFKVSILFAQSIPDKNFTLAIQIKCSSCITIKGDGTGELIQPAAGNLKVLEVEFRNISDLTGINGFTSLTELYCYDNQLTSLPALPTGLTLLSCFNNQLTSLPTLPSGLTQLYCYNNQLTSLPALPSSLAILDCIYNQLTSLPTLPNGLNTLYFDDTKIPCISYSGNGLKLYNANLTNFGYGQNYPKCVSPHIPDTHFASAIKYACSSCISINGDGTGELIQPAAGNLTSLDVGYPNTSDLTGINGFTNLQYLYCCCNQLTSLPALPNGLKLLYCYNNQLTSLPALPTGLIYLYCYNNKLTSLPDLPGSLKQLACHYNQLTSLPALPTGLMSLSCNNNQLISLPALPTGLINLYCNNNQLTSLPTLPSGLTKLQFDNTKIGCIMYSGIGLNLYDANGNYLDLGQNYPQCTLPVEMTEFMAKSDNTQTVHLYWQTASEQNNNRFDIERSTDGHDYAVIGEVKGNGTTQVTHEYQFTDDKIPVAGIYYYRLNQIDIDGTSKFSSVVSVEIADTKLHVYPTVVNDHIYISSTNNTLPVTITDITGRVMLAFTTTPESIDVSNLDAGMYIVRVGNETVRVIKTDR